MKPLRIIRLFVRRLLAIALGIAALSAAGAEQSGREKSQAQFLQLCDLAASHIRVETNKGAFFIDSYAIRALCVAYNLTGKKSYLEACQKWSDRMVAFQEKMIPQNAYYMNYNRKPGQDKGGWYVADSSSIAMGVLATAVRCQGAGQRRYLDSAKAFAKLVMDNYIAETGGVRNGAWPKSTDEWWCSTGIFGSLAALLFDETGDEQYLKAALGAVDWLNQQDLTKDERMPEYALSKMGPTKLMYVLEAYSAGLSHLEPGSPRHKAALKQISWCAQWMGEQQSQPPAGRAWPCDRGWGMKFGGLPFHQYVYARLLPGRRDFSTAADREMDQLASVLFAKKPEYSQLVVFMMMSYSERLCPGAIYRNSRTPNHPSPKR